LLLSAAKAFDSPLCHVPLKRLTNQNGLKKVRASVVKQERERDTQVDAIALIARVVFDPTRAEREESTAGIRAAWKGLLQERALLPNIKRATIEIGRERRGGAGDAGLEGDRGKLREPGVGLAGGGRGGEGTGNSGA